MPAPLRKEDDDDLYDEDFDFVDEDDSETEGSFGAGIIDDADDEPAKKKPAKAKRKKAAKKKTAKKAEAAESKPAKKKKKAAKKKVAKKKAKPAEPVEEVVDEPAAEEAPPEPASAAAESVEEAPAAEEAPAEAPVPEKVEPPKPPTDHRVHVYEYGKLKRTITREFTAEDAEAYATEFTRSGKAYGLVAEAGTKDEEPLPTAP